MTRLLIALHVFDALLVLACAWVSTAVTGWAWTNVHLVAGLLAACLYWVSADATGLYGSWRGMPMKNELSRVWSSFAFAVAGLLLLAYLTDLHAPVSRGSALFWLIITPTSLMLARAALRVGVRELRRKGHNTRTVAIAGATPVALALAREIEAVPWAGLRLHGFYDDRQGAESNEAARVVRIPERRGRARGDFEALVEDARGGRIDIVYIALPLRAEARIRELVAGLADTTVSVHVVADVFLTELMQARFASLGSLPVISVFDHPFHGVDGTLKRVEDIVVGSIILALVSLPMLAIAAAVKLTSRGPVIFRQRRYGLDGKEITVLKFRTMTVCEDGDRVRQAKVGDPRVTRLGAFLRRTSLDELPQFLNVLAGEMSIVGPRPHAVAHNEEYRRLIPGYMLRHKVKPGITGWAQVNGWRGETDTLHKMKKRVEHDLAYIRDWRLWLDLKIIFLTVFGRQTWSNAH
jgi:putative colanic acid biosynthesis UDP-glucose lipid carrier transferase